MNKNLMHRALTLVFLAALLAASSSFLLFKGRAASASPVRAEGGRVAFGGGEASYLRLGAEASPVAAVYQAGAGVARLAGETRAHALASADFDEDGTPDLVGGYEAAGGGVVTVQRGNVDAVYPNSPEARARRAEGSFSDAPFHEAAAAFDVPEAAQFVGAGDFDADGHADVVAARRGGRALYLLRGDGRGNLSEAERVELKGSLTAFTTGEVNRRDGLTDIVVGVVEDSGAAALVFESPAGALRGEPESFAVPAAVSGVALGALDSDSSYDLALAAGNELLVVRGRDRRLSLDESLRADVPAAEPSRDAFEFALAGVAIGDFAGDSRADVAVLSADGAVQVLTRAGGDGWQRDGRARVGAAENASAASDAPGLLLTAKVSSLAKDDLLLLSQGRAHVVANEAAKPKAVGKSKRGTAASAGLNVSASIDADDELAAVLPMRLNASALDSLVVVGADGKAPSVLSQAAAVTFTVNSTADTEDAARGNGECKDSNGNCTLRAVVQEIDWNTNPGPYTINFNIPGAGVPTISTTGSLINNAGVTFGKPVLIDGTTQPAGRVEIVDTAGNNGLLRLSGGNSTVRGLVMSGFGSGAIWLSNSNNVIEGCYFGTNADGTAAATRKGQTSLLVTSSDNHIGGTTAAARNVISGGTDRGIEVRTSTGNLIQGNYIGTNAAGTAAIGNSNYGVYVSAPDAIVGGTAPGAGNLFSGNGGCGGPCPALYLTSGAFVVQGNRFGMDASGNSRIANGGDALQVYSRHGATTIGGTTPAARNVISGSQGVGIAMDSPEDSAALIQGNYIGTSADGTVALPNLGGGLLLDRVGIAVGGTAPGAGNLISGNGGDGISLLGFYGSPSHIIQGNLIGTDVSGTLALPNGGDGIKAWRADATLIGGTAPAARNTISGNRGHGLNLGKVDNPANSPVRVQGNYIGTNRFGTAPLGNGGHGVFTRTGYGSGNRIGGADAGAANLIAYNVESGVADSGEVVGAAVLSNSIHSNGALGIDQQDDGVSPISNESDLNRPELLSANNTEAGTVVTGKLYTYGSLQPFTIQFFSNPSCDPSGYGEGQTLVGQTTVAAPTRYSYINFSATLSPAVPGGATVTAVNVRTPDANYPGAVYTSEFSNCLQLAAPTPTPTPTPGPTATPTPTSTPTPTPTPTPLQLFVIAPARGGDAAAATRQLTGRGFLPGATVKLTRAGQPNIVGTAVSVTNNGTTLTATFDLTGRARGLWSVVVTNPDGQSATLSDAFTIGEARAANVWIDVIGRYSMRMGREQTFYLAYGNTGDVSAAPTLIHVFIPKALSLRRPPRLEDGTLPVVDSVEDGALLKFFVPAVAPGSAVYLPFTLEAGNNVAHTKVRLSAWAKSSTDYEAIGELRPDPSVTYTREVVQVTPGHVREVIRAARGAESEEVTYDYFSETVTEPQELSVKTEVVNGETRNVIEFTIPKTPSASSKGSASSQRQEYERLKMVSTPIDIDTTTFLFGGLKARSAQFELHYQALLDCLKRLRNPPFPQKGYNIPDKKIDDLRAKADGYISFQFTHGFEYGVISIAEVFKAKIDRRLNSFEYEVVDLYCSAVENMGHCSDVETKHILLEEILRDCNKYQCQKEIDHPKSPQVAASRASAGADSAAPGSCDSSRNPILELLFASDPNDKVGPQGEGDKRYVTGSAPSSYAVFFENKPEANAPAQDVVVTDQLDLTKFDLSTFQLGPVSFGKDRFVAPPPGLSQWTADVDLRPANNLVVRIDAGLNPQTGVVRWAFTSLDPSTMQPTEDPSAGFLPPNKTAPEGEGSVLFSVSPKPGVQTGDQVRNGARIVFDVNAPIDTPVWLNTVDKSIPSSAVKQLAATQPYIVFNVDWAGADTGSGLRDYTVFFSEDGGPYTAWLSETTETSAIFAGKPGKTYSFYSVARDRAGNVEAAKSSPEATTATPNVVVNSIDDARFFVLRHYRDFLGRDPDASGFDFWTNEIAACGGDAGCIDVKRTNVSQAFFLSIEFQQTGYLAHRFYRATFADSAAHPRGLPRMDELLADALSLSEDVVVGAQGWEQRLEQNKQAFARAWVERPEVLAQLPSDMTAAQFVDRLFANSGVTPAAAERDAALSAFGAGGTEGRAAALRSVADSRSVYNRQYNAAFVLMQYVGYLRRNPYDPPDQDFSGYDYWLAKMDSFSAAGEDVRDPATAQGRVQRAEMVRAFITSDEYRRRFVQ